MTREEKSSACSGRRNKKTDRSGDAANHSAARAELKRGIREVQSAYRGRTEDCCRCGRGYQRIANNRFTNLTVVEVESPEAATLHPPTSPHCGAARGAAHAEGIEPK